MIHFALLLAAASVGNLPDASTPLDADTTASVVRYDDLDLNSAAGRTKLSQRIGLAIRRVCDEPGLPPGERARWASACVDAARHRAEHDVAQAIASTATSQQTATTGERAEIGPES
jgi:UrcA family protein